MLLLLVNLGMYLPAPASPRPMFALLVLLMIAVVIGFYTVTTNNYGGYASACVAVLAHSLLVIAFARGAGVAGRPVHRPDPELFAADGLDGDGRLRVSLPVADPLDPASLPPPGLGQLLMR